MRLKCEPGSGAGYTVLTDLSGRYKEMSLGFGILRVSREALFSDAQGLERAYMLLCGEADIVLSGITAGVARTDMLEELPTVAHLPAGEPVEIRSRSETAEFAVFSVGNGKGFKSRIIRPRDIIPTRLVSGKLKDSTERELRTVLDDKGDPFSNMTIGELVNVPGKWSSYPPHIHPHPEIYHYRFFPDHGFGYSQVGEEVHLVRNGDTVLIPPKKAHPQVSAPGFTMLYIWGMPHLPEERFGADSRKFLPEYTHLLDS